LFVIKILFLPKSIRKDEGLIVVTTMTLGASETNKVIMKDSLSSMDISILEGKNDWDVVNIAVNISGVSALQ
jgi:hypothetical protein